MDKTELVTLFDYNYWANALVLDAAAKVSPDQFIAPAGLSHGSLRGALVHILAAEIVWRLRCQEGISPAALPGEEDFPTLELLRQRWANEEQAMRGFLAGLSDGDLAGTVRYTTTKGLPQENVLWQPLMHVVNHGTQFRAEAAVALSHYGRSPGDLDLIYFLRQHA
jgi:uncharacterized damage-inducible protein DinB